MMIAEPLRPLARPVGEFRLLDGNPRRGDVESVKRSLKRFGQRKPIVVREDGTVEAGNTTLKAALELGWSEIAVVAFGDDDATAKAFALADNRTSELGSFDLAALAAMAVEVHAADPGLLEAASYSEADLNALLDGQKVPEKRTDPDDVPEPPAEPVTQPGDLWLLGPHRLLCGNAASGADHVLALDGSTPDLVLTDPPYGVGVNYGDHCDDSLDMLDELIPAVMPLLQQHPTVLLTPGVPAMWKYPRPAWVLGWMHPASTSSGPWGYVFLNPILAYGSDPYLKKGLGRRPGGLVLATDRNGEEEHPTSKPFKVWSWLLERGSTAQGDVVFDPFMGSGTTLIAAHALGRRCIGIEMSPQWVDAACRRYQEHTGTKPVLQSTGQPHDFTA